MFFVKKHLDFPWYPKRVKYSKALIYVIMFFKKMPIKYIYSNVNVHRKSLYRGA